MKREFYYDTETGSYQDIPTKYLTCNLSDKELLDVFPEAKEIIPEKLKEWEERKMFLLDDEIKPLVKKIGTIKDEFSRWFSKKILKVMVSQNLNSINGNIIRLKRMERLIEKPKGFYSRRKVDYARAVEQARSYPIDKIISSVLDLRMAGKNYMAKCPFHEDKSPSFCVYPDTNSFYCFGCNKGGDVINFVESYYNYNFKEAIEYIQAKS